MLGKNCDACPLALFSFALKPALGYDQVRFSFFRLFDIKEIRLPTCLDRLAVFLICHAFHPLSCLLNYASSDIQRIFLLSEPAELSRQLLG